jgi:SNF2-related domain
MVRYGSASRASLPLPLCPALLKQFMVTTEYQAKYIAYELTKRSAPDSADKLAGVVAGAQVDLNPHQVDAALFAFSSPLSKGALLADEVGLGKTIEAGLVISQRWAERKRCVLIITPSNLRKQWHQELSEKFFLPCTILESRSYNEAIKSGRFRPFDVKDTVVICSYQFARNKAADVHAMPWDLVVIDEAHRLRNVYKPSNVIANTLKHALAQKQKLLLTATPLQNSLLELFGLVSFIDEHTFGDLKSFREQFANLAQDRVFHVLKERLKPLCHRTLRRQVTAYVPYTRRLALVEEFTPSDGEDRLYELVSEYLRRDNLQALPASQRSLMTLVLRKLLASSTFAIAGALSSISQRMQAKLKKHEVPASLEDGVDFEKRISAIYQQCRQTEEIKTAFDQLQLELSLEINEAMSQTRQKLLENFDDEVREKLKIRDEDAKVYLDRFEQQLMRLTRYELNDSAEFLNASSFRLKSKPTWTDGRAVPLGLYELPRRSGEAHLYRLNHPLGEAIVDRAKVRKLATAELTFDYSNHSGKVSALEPLIGKTGWLVAAMFTVEALDQAEDHILLSGLSDAGEQLSDDGALRLLTLAGRVGSEAAPPVDTIDRLNGDLRLRQHNIQRLISERNARFFEAEADKLDGWADDLKVGLEREIKEIDRQIKEARRAATTALTLEEKLAGQKQIKSLEVLRNQKRRSLFDAQDEIDRQRAELIAQIEGKLQQQVSLLPLFSIRWKLV